MDWIKLLTAYGLGFVTLVAIEYGLAQYRKHSLVEEESPEDDEEDYIIRVLESILFMDMEYEGITIMISRTKTEGINVVKLIFHEFDEDTQEEIDIIHYAIVNGLRVSLVTPAEWAFELGGDGVRSMPTMEDLEDIEGFFEATDDEDEDSEDDQ